MVPSFYSNLQKIPRCGTVDSTVASNTRGHGFESSHRQLLLDNYLLLTDCRKGKNKGKEAENGPFLKHLSMICFVTI